MSIVGTRPPLISETNLYEPRHKARLATLLGYLTTWVLRTKYLQDFIRMKP